MESSSDDEYSNAKNLPDTPLVSFDLNFESLKSFLEGISHIVNDHTKIIKKMNF